MLTKNDLQAIREVVKTELDENLDTKIKLVLQKELKPIKRQINKIDKTLNIFVRRTDEEDVKLDRRVERIENHFGLEPPKN